MAEMQDMARIKRNVRKMVSQGAPETDIDAYIASEGTTIDAVRAFQPDASQDGQGGTKPSAAHDAGIQFGQSFNRGLYSMINAPTAIANAGMSAIGADYRFQRPLEVVAPGADKQIMTVPEAQTAAGRVAGTVGEYAGANALPGMGMIAAAPRIAAATAGSQGILGQSVNRMASSVAAAPGTAAAGEALSTAGAGVGAQLARDAAPGNATAEFLAATAGGIAAPAAVALSPTNIARKGANAVRRRLSPEAQARAQRKALGDAIRRNMTPEDEARIRETADIQRTVRGYEPSVAEATESPSFIATQREFEAGLSGPDLDQATRRYALNERAVGDAVGELAPQSTMTPDDVFAQARARPRRVQGQIERRLGGLDEAARAEADTIAPKSSRAAMGESIRTQIDLERDTVKAGMSRMAREMGLNATRKAYRFDDGVKRRLIEAVEPRSKLADAGAQPSGIVADIKAMDDSVSITDLMALRTRITDDIRTFTARPDGKRKVEYLESLLGELDNVSDDIIRSAGDGQLADNLRKFRAEYRDQLIEPFEQGAVGRVMKRDLSGTYRVPDEDVARQFFNGWNQTAARQYRRVFQNAPYANATMEAAALDDLYASAVVDGILDPGRMANWARRNQGVLNEFPEIRARVGSVQSAVDDLARRRAVLMGRKQAVEQAYLSREIARLDAPMASTTAEDVIDQAIRNPARMTKLMRSIKSQPARDAIARRVWEMALSQSDPVGYLRRNGLAASSALGDKYPIAMRLARAIEKNNLVARPAGRGLDPNPVASLEGVLGTGLNQMSSRVFAVQSGRTSSRYALADIAGRAFRTMTGNQARQALQQAIYDPQAATDLANALQMGAMSQPQAKRLYTFLISNGIVAMTPNQDNGG